MTITERIRSFLRPYDMNERALTPAQVWGRGGTWQPLSSAGVSVTIESAMQAATGACIRLLADDISSLPVDVFRKVDGVTQDSDRPAWLEYPTGRRWDTFQAYLSDAIVSMLSDGNVFIECVPNTFNPTYFKVHDPTTIEIEQRGGALIYRNGLREWDETAMAHIPWVRLPGKLRGMSVLDAARDATGLELAARQWASAFFANGGTLGTVIEHPGKPSKEEADIMRESFDAQHQGSANAWKLGLVTGGAKLAYGGRVLPREAELAPLWKHVLEEAARLYHIPPHLLGSQDPGGSSYSSVEHRSIEYVEHAMVPITTRIEAAHDRFLSGTEFLKINTNALLRGDVKSRASWYQMALTNKVMRPSEVRDKEDLPFDAENTGYLQTPNNNAPDDYVGDEPGDDPKAAGITIQGEYRDEHVERLIERVTEAVSASQERMRGDVLAQAEEVRIAALRAIKTSTPKPKELLPIRTTVQRDEHNRIIRIDDKQGGHTRRRVVDRAADGSVISITEVSL